MKFTTRLFAAMILGALLVGAPGPSFAQNALQAPGQKPIGGTSGGKQDTVPSLIVLNAGGATLKGDTLTLTGVSSNAVIFADRPARQAGHALTRHLLEEWNHGDSFAKDPPNATVSVLSKDADDVEDAVVTLKSPKLEGTTLTFTVDVLEGKLAQADGPAAVFIDIIGLPFTPLSYAGVARRTARRAAFYGAAAYPYYGPYYRPYYAPPACGYYPYPPCY